jgi:hypothetical protein
MLSAPPAAHPFDLDVDDVPGELDLFAEEFEDPHRDPPTMSCNCTLSTVLCDCLETVSTIYCYSADEQVVEA